MKTNFFGTAVAAALGGLILCSSSLAAASQVPEPFQGSDESSNYATAEVGLKIFSRDEQLAYWLNLYNVTLLNDIQYTILKQNYDGNPLVIYGLYQGIMRGAHRSCPL